VSNSDVAAPFFTVGGTAASISSSNLASPSAIIALSLLTPGVSYAFVLSVTESSGASCYSTVLLVMNSPPSSGNIEPTPFSGFALETAFTFTALNWVDPDLPFSYAFGSAVVKSFNVDGHAVFGSLFPFGGATLSATYTGITLAQGPSSVNGTVGCFVDVIDAYGAIGSGYSYITVTSKNFTIAELTALSAAKTTSALQQGDGDAAKQVLVATTTAMAPLGIRRRLATSQTSNLELLQRSLEQGPNEATTLRAQVLENLVSTYRITPVTQTDMASLLSVLVGIVNVPSQVTSKMSLASLEFLNTVSKI
jgi:hypothetical protein